MTAAADNQPKRASGATGRAFAWWLGELRGVWDDLTRRFDVRSGTSIVIEAGERYWIVRQRQRVLGQIDRAAPDADEMRRSLARLGQSAGGRTPLVVEIPQERVLTRRITLPATAQGQIERVLHFEIARLFPFPAERVHFRHRIIAEGGLALERGAIEVEVVAVAREVVAEITAALAEAGLKPSAICITSGGSAAPLYLPGTAIGGGPAVTGLNRALLIALGLLAAAALASPVLHGRLLLAGAQSEIDGLKPKAQAALDAREQQQREAAQTASPLRLKAARPPLVAVLDELTKAVPDGAWLISLSISGREIVIDGLSPSAAATALALEQSRVFTNVVFRSPISRDPQSGLERFQLSAAIAEPKS